MLCIFGAKARVVLIHVKERPRRLLRGVRVHSLGVKAARAVRLCVVPHRSPRRRGGSLRPGMPTVPQIRPPPRTAFSGPPASSAGALKREVTCAKCNLRETCLSGGVPAEDLARVENIVYARRRIRRGEHLFIAGDEFRCLYAIRAGFFKTSLVDSEGREQVTGFFMSGELLGMDGLGSGRCAGSAIALEDSDVCAMPYSLIEEIGREVPSLQRRLHSVLAREIVRDHGVMLLLGSMRAEERLAAFLLNLSKRFQRRGYSESEFHLRMTREEIGSYLGLKLETVSRLLSAFQKPACSTSTKSGCASSSIAGLERVLAASGLAASQPRSRSAGAARGSAPAPACRKADPAAPAPRSSPPPSRRR